MPIRFARYSALLLLLPIPALAFTAFTRESVNLRAGPDRSFPRVTWLAPRTPVNVIGCTSGWRWCDVRAGRNRGWVDARYLSNSVRGRAPIVRFSPGPYWDQNYRDRPWYGNRSDWSNWGSPSFRPPPSPPVWRPGTQPSRPPPSSPGFGIPGSRPSPSG